MYALTKAKEEAVKLLETALPEGAAVSVGDLVEPPQKDMGDLAYPCFALAEDLSKTLSGAEGKKSPADIAKEVALKIEASSLIESAHAVGPYVNFRLERSAFSAEVVGDVLGAADGYGKTDDGNERLIIEYGQPNTHKEVHVGHLRNLFLGLSVVRMQQSVGNTVIPVNYIGDVGAHVAKCLWAYKKYHEDETPEPGREGKFLGGIYTEASQRIEEDESLKEEVSEVQRVLEAGDSEWTELWKKTRQWSLDEMDNIFEELGCDFTRTYLESEVEGPGKKLVKELLDKGTANRSQGAIIMDFESEGLGVFLLLKSDGSALYATKELALARLKFEEYEADASIHVVDVRQSLYFRQFFRTLQIMGFDKRMVHLSYDFVTLKDGAMSSRKGNVITYGEFRDEIVRRAAEETRRRHTEWDDKRISATAWIISEGAMKFSMLKQDNDRPIVFDIDSALSFDGFTGPYVQYAHARMSSILGKVEESWSLGVKEYSDFTPEEFEVLRRVAVFPEIVSDAAREFRPSLVAQYAFELAQEASAFYRDVPVLNAVPDDRERRLAIVRAVRSTLARALFLLGIEAPEEM
ncbi:MAG: arginine--tRNA ligase [Patescibacteria group bacterium]|nr:arginine--tRNA ligase [Patescibacteria group bacterium]